VVACGEGTVEGGGVVVKLGQGAWCLHAGKRNLAGKGRFFWADGMGEMAETKKDCERCGTWPVYEFTMKDHDWEPSFLDGGNMDGRIELNCLVLSFAGDIWKPVMHHCLSYCSSLS